MLPMARPVIGVVLYFSFNAAWNNFMGPYLVLMSDQTKWPMAVILFHLQEFLTNLNPEQLNNPAVEALKSSGAGFNALMALALVQSAPVFIMFIIFREQIMKGIRLRGFK